GGRGSALSTRRSRPAEPAMTSRRMGGLLAALILALALVGPLLRPEALSPVADGVQLAAPSLDHWLGTDAFARDVFARLARGARLSLAIATLAVGLATVLGVGLGVLA